MRIEQKEETISCELSLDELLIIRSCLCEISFGIKIHAFKTRIGFEKDDVANLAKEVSQFVKEKGIEE